MAAHSCVLAQHLSELSYCTLLGCRTCFQEDKCGCGLTESTAMTYYQSDAWSKKSCKTATFGVRRAASSLSSCWVGFACLLVYLKKHVSCHLPGPSQHSVRENRFLEKSILKFRLKYFPLPIVNSVSPIPLRIFLREIWRVKLWTITAQRTMFP